MTEFLPLLIAAALGLVAVVIDQLRRRKAERFEAPTVPLPRPPKHTAEEHETATALDTADVVDQAAADHHADPNDVAELVELADKTRR